MVKRMDLNLNVEGQERRRRLRADENARYTASRSNSR